MRWNQYRDDIRVLTSLTRDYIVYNDSVWFNGQIANTSSALDVEIY